MGKVAPVVTGRAGGEEHHGVAHVPGLDRDLEEAALAIEIGQR